MLKRLMTGASYRAQRMAARVTSGFMRPGVIYGVEQADWVIREMGVNMMRSLRQQQPDYDWHVADRFDLVFNRIVHFGSLWTFAGGVRQLPEGNRVVATIFHGEPESAEFSGAFEAVEANRDRLSAVVTSCSQMRRRLIDWGVAEDRLVVVPIGLDLKTFQPVTPESRKAMRESLGLPEDAFVIGSFQKDGCGWGEGMEPKPVKGPDVFLEALSLLPASVKPFVLLTGPSRGFVKQGLDRLGIPWHHDFLDDPREIAPYYHALDAYVIASRDEGGPKAVMEGMASGIPVISTRVGMAIDIIRDRINGRLVDVEDPSAIAEAIREVAEDRGLRDAMVNAGFSSVEPYDYAVIAEAAARDLYLPLLEGRQVLTGI